MTARASRSPRPSASERRSQILREAMRCFSSNGFRGTTTREIAARVGITEAALYRYFDSKQSLYDALIDEKIAVAPVQELIAEVAAQRDDHAVFTTLAHELIERALADPDFVRLLFFTALEEHELADRFFRSRIGRLSGFVTDYLRARMDEGAFAERDSALAARAFLGMVFDYINVRVIFAQADAYLQATDEAVDNFVGIFLAGMRNANARPSDRSSK